MTNFEISTIKKLMAKFTCDWAVCGGQAIDLFLGKQTRVHKDIDLFIWRDEQLYAQKYFQERGWQLQKAIAGELIDWEEGEFLELPIHTIWCKHPSHKLNFVELLMNESDDTHFLFRRDKTIKRLKGEVILLSKEGVPYLTPEIALLYKSNNIEHEGNQHDFDVCVSELSDVQREWLNSALRKLYEEHTWLVKL